VGKTVYSRSGKNLPVGRPRKIFNRARVAELRARGISYRQIAAILGVGEGTVRRVFGDAVIEAPKTRSANSDGGRRFKRFAPTFHRASKTQG
jgi:DNA invertase Pin-like site-specific DNA recombinase